MPCGCHWAPAVARRRRRGKGGPEPAERGPQSAVGVASSCPGGGEGVAGQTDQQQGPWRVWEAWRAWEALQAWECSLPAAPWCCSTVSCLGFDITGLTGECRGQVALSHVSLTSSLIDTRNSDARCCADASHSLSGALHLQHLKLGRNSVVEQNICAGKTRPHPTAAA